MEKAKLKKLCTTAFYILCLTVAVVYVAFHLYRLLTSDIVTVRATVTEHSNTVSLSAYIARDEIPIGSGDSACVLHLYGNGAKLTSGTKVAQIYPQDKDAVVRLISDIHAEIDIIERAMRPATVEKLNADSSDAYISLMKMLSGNSLSVSAYAEELLLANSAKEHIVDRNILNSKLADLKSELENLTSFLGTPTDTLYMPTGGYFFTQNDGYGELFTAALAENGTADEMMNAISAYSRGIGRGETGCGIATRFSSWYFIVPIDSSKSNGYFKGSSYELVLDKYGVRLNATLYDIRNASDGGESCLVFSVSDVPSDFSYERCTEITLIKDTQKGYRIPTSAIRTLQDGSTGVYILSGGVVLFRRVEILTSTDSYCFVKSEEQYMEELAEGRRTEAIFRSNGGSDSFVGLFGATDGEVLIKTDNGNVCIDPTVDEEKTEYAYLAQDEFVIVNGTGLYHGRIAPQ